MKRHIATRIMGLGKLRIGRALRPSAREPCSQPSPLQPYGVSAFTYCHPGTRGLLLLRKAHPKWDSHGSFKVLLIRRKNTRTK